MDPDTAAEQRANAVARLRRAASLPRMKDGRRPPVPMHGEAGGVSEGERSQGEGKQDDQTTSTTPEAEGQPESATEPPSSSADTDTTATAVTSDSTATMETPANDDAQQHDAEVPEPDADAELEPEPEPEPEQAAEPETENERSPTPASGAESSTTKEKTGKRRTRSRSRSRGSKDLRAKARAANEAASAQATVGSDGADDESPPALANPAQHYFMQHLQLAAAQAQAQVQGQPKMISPLSPFGYGAPPPSAPAVIGGVMGTAGIPTLQDLQTRHLQGGLFRSSSAAARMMTMQKLIGGTDPLGLSKTGISGNGTPRAGSPLGTSHTTGGARLGLGGLTRNNTVAGGERIAARQQLLRRLNERIQEKERSDVETTSGAEENGAGPTAATKGRRRRSRRKSQSNVVDDRDLAAITAASTPSATPAPPEDLLIPYPPPPSTSPGPSGTGIGGSRPFSPFSPLGALTSPLPPSRAPSVPLEKQQQQQQLLQQFQEFQAQQVQQMQQLEALRRTPDPHRILRQHTPSPMPAAPQTVPNQRPTPEMQFCRTPDPRTPTPTATTPEPSSSQNSTNHYQYDSPMVHRGLVIEDEDPDDFPAQPTPPPRSARGPIPGLPTPPNTQTPTQQSAKSPAMRLPHSSDAPSALSTDSSDSNGGHHVPVILSEADHHRNPFHPDMFPKSPFGTPINERTLPQRGDGRVLYRNAPVSARAERSRFPRGVSEVSNTTVGEHVSWVTEPIPAIPPYAMEMRDSEISWDAQPVPEYHSQRGQSERERTPIVSWITEPGGLPVFDEDDGEEEEEDDEDSKEIPVEDTAPQPSASPAHSHHSPVRDSRVSQEIIVEQDASEGTLSFASKPSHQSTTSTATINTNARESAMSDISSAPRDSSLNLMGRTTSQVSQADSMQLDAWSDVQHGDIPPASGLSTKRSADSSSATTWSSKVKSFMRSGSSLGRRSRTNSIVREKKESAATESSRESGASLGQISNKRESRGDTPAPSSATGSAILTWQQGQTLLSSPSPSASTAMLPLQVPPPPRSGVSPIPPASESDAQRYNDPKLFPFPGMVQSLRRGMSASTSSPEIATQSSTSGRPMTPSLSSSLSGQDTLGGRDRKLSHQASDSRLLQKYQITAPTVSGAPSSASPVDYFNVIQQSQSTTTSNILPQTREGVKKWLSVRRLFTSTSQGSNSPSPLQDNKVQAQTQKKPSLSDLLNEKDIEDWEETVKPVESLRMTNSPNMNNGKAREALNNDHSPKILQEKPPLVVPTMKEQEVSESSPDDPMAAYDYVASFQSPRPEEDRGGIDSYDAHESRHLSAPLSSSHDQSSATPDPASSEESPSQSTERSETESSMGSIYSPHDNHTDPPTAAQAKHILERLDQELLSDERGPLWNNALNSPPRKLLLSSPMLQVANHSTVKDRFLFLFSDLVVIAKPMLPDRDSLLDPSKLYPPDRKFIIKNVVHLKDLRLNVDRDEDASKPSSAFISQRPEFIRNFVQEFSVNPDAAISRVINLDDPRSYATLGKLLVQLPEINRAKLGEYLSRRSSRHVLKAYIDAFGFAGLGIEEALRIFLLSMHIPATPGNPLEGLLDVFAARWFEANDGIVAYSREIVPVLVRAIVRLNEKIHPSLAQDISPLAYSRPVVNCRDFIDAFRVHDHRGMVSDNVLQSIFNSIKAVKLCQARNPTNGRAPLLVSLKRPIPSYITYKRQSEPVIVRIPQQDDKLEIHLFGQDITFDPPILTFGGKSTEASFRITGNALGTKTIIMACLGPNAPNYSGLPLSTTVNVERAFMRNTFQIAFLNHVGVKRKYMFSVDDPVIKHEWIGSLKRQIEALNQSQTPTVVNFQVYRAAEALSFKVLQETLLAGEASSPNDTARGNSGHGKTASSDSSGPVPNSPYGSSTVKEIYKRSQSRSQMYRYGAGRHESDLSNGADESADGFDQQGSNTKLWTGAELELLCQQNSSIALVLSFLQAALPFEVSDDPSTAAFSLPLQRNVSQSSGYRF